MSVHYEDDRVTLHHGDCLDVLRSLPDSSVDSVVCDPPYGLSNTDPAHVADTVVRWVNGERDYLPPVKGGFMGKEWDSFVPPVAVWDECYRVLKPGGHVLAFAGSRTHDLMTLGIRLAGFDIRDSIAWLYAQGFPKSLDVSKAIDKRRDWTALPLLQAKVREARKGLGISQSEAARRVGLIGPDESLGGGGFMWFETGMRVPTREQYPRLKAALGLDDECDRAFEEAEREVTGTHVEWTNRVNYALTSRDGLRRDKPATPDAERWQGWGTALKPAFEPIVVARKPLAGTVAANVLAWGTGALNVDGCRIAVDPDDPVNTAVWTSRPSTIRPGTQGFITSHADGERSAPRPPGLGRWPANIVLDEDMADVLDEQSGTLTSGANPTRRGADGDRQAYGEFGGQDDANPQRGADSGGASRFFYVAKADASERPRLPKRSLRLRDDLTPEQVDHVRARLVEAGVQVD